MRPVATTGASRILRFTSWSDMSTPPELSSASVFALPPLSENSMRARCVKPRFPPSPTAWQRSWSTLTRTASFDGSPASAWVSEADFTYVPIPPFHSSSTGASSTARMSVSPSITSGVSSEIPRARRACGESSTSFAPRGTIIPPSLSRLWS